MDYCEKKLVKERDQSSNWWTKEDRRSTWSAAAAAVAVDKMKIIEEEEETGGKILDNHYSLALLLDIRSVAAAVNKILKQEEKMAALGPLDS